MSEKPIVKIKDPKIFRGALHGEVTSHPKLPDGTYVKTSPILKIETKNTIYVLENK